MDNIRAFPNSYRDTDDWPVVEDGMTLRDYFAAKAMQGFLEPEFVKGLMSQCKGGDKTSFATRNIAKDSYKIADAMLAEREKGNE